MWKHGVVIPCKLFITIACITLFFTYLYVKQKQEHDICSYSICLLDETPEQVPDDLEIPYPGKVILNLSSTTTHTIHPFVYTRINNIYASKEGLVYYIEPNMRYTSSPVYLLVEGADVETFMVSESTYDEWGLAYDEDNVFFDGKKVEVDRQSFEEIGSGYFKDSQYVYLAARDESVYELILYKRDVSTFRVFTTGSDGNDYTMDKNGVYFAGRYIDGVDPRAFAIHSSPADIYRNYKQNDLDLSSVYMRDASHVVYQGVVIDGANPDTFKVIFTGPYLQEYGKDGTRVYYKNSVIAGADPKTFTPLSRQLYEGCRLGMYGIDKGAVYYESNLMPGVDPTSFKALHDEYGKDVSHVYLSGIIQEHLDPRTFVFECNYG